MDNTLQYDKRPFRARQVTRELYFCRSFRSSEHDSEKCPMSIESYELCKICKKGGYVVDTCFFQNISFSPPNRN